MPRTDHSVTRHAAGSKRQQMYHRVQMEDRVVTHMTSRGWELLLHGGVTGAQLLTVLTAGLLLHFCWWYCMACPSLDAERIFRSGGGPSTRGSGGGVNAVWFFRKVL